MRGLVVMIRTVTMLFLREPAAVFFTLAFPLMILLIFGAVFGNSPSPEYGGHGSVDVSIQGYIAMVIGTVTLIGLPVTLSASREFGVLRRLRATPLSAATVVAAHVAVNAAFALFGVLLLVLAAKLIYDVRLPQLPVGVAAAWSLSFVAFCAVGFLLVGLLPTARTAQAVGSAIYFPQLFLSGAALPRTMFPETLKEWTAPLPMTQSVTLLYDLWHGEGWDWPAAALLSGVALVAAALGTRFFRWE
ncbi:MAG: ABC transporter permease [Chloroflexia bacterium]|nr:ABC transporter permease [Chloroflexia bacterium]MBA3642375.1 ABC transporter permease [Acidobacteriota bacterium]